MADPSLPDNTTALRMRLLEDGFKELREEVRQNFVALGSRLDSLAFVSREVYEIDQRNLRESTNERFGSVQAGLASNVREIERLRKDLSSDLGGRANAMRSVLISLSLVVVAAALSAVTALVVR